jgi:uncharacterized delta-60 repeat protein
MTSVGGNDVCNAVALQSDGKIILAGSSDSNVAVVRYTSDGQVDSTFGTNGKTIQSFGDGNDRAYCVTVLPDDSIVIGGWTEIGTLGDSVSVVPSLAVFGCGDASYGGIGRSAAVRSRKPRSVSAWC